MSGIIYSAVARGRTMLCSDQMGGGNFNAVAESMLANISTASNTRTSYTGEDQTTFHVVVQNGLIYLCATDRQFRKQRAYDFLDEIVKRFTGGTLVVRSQTASHMELQRDFSNVLSTQMSKYSKESGDNISVLQAQVNEVKGVMTQNIEKVLQRGDKLDDLLSKTTDLEASSNSFKKTTRQIARKYWWQNLRMKIIIAVVVIVVIGILAIVICASTGVFKSSGGTSSDSTTTTTTTGKSQIG